MIEGTWCERMYMVWEKVLRIVVVTQFVSAGEKIQTVLQKFLFCTWGQQVKMSHLDLSPKLHDVTSQKIVIEMIYVTRVNRKVFHGPQHL